MSNKTALKKILDHPDKDEIISKLIIGTTPKDIHDWLAIKYTNVSESKFVIAEKSLLSFKDNYLDIYNDIRADLGKTKSALSTLSVEDELQLAVQDSPTYRSKMIELANGELDIKGMLSRLIINTEERISQIFDEIAANPRDINSRTERLWLEYTDRLGQHLERWSKLVLQAPDMIVQHNVSVQHTDQQVQFLQEALREALAEVDNEASLRFMDIMSDKLSSAKLPSEKEIIPTEVRLAEVKLLNEEINKKLNDEEPEDK